jgi:hypothetical protein
MNIDMVQVIIFCAQCDTPLRLRKFDNWGTTERCIACPHYNRLPPDEREAILVGLR